MVPTSSEGEQELRCAIVLQIIALTQRFNAATANLRNLMMEELNTVRKLIEQGRLDSAPMLRELLRESDGNRLSDDEVIDNFIVFMIAGFDTTSATLTAVLLAIAQRPDIQQK